jgi:cellulose biosynthesis protein BcsQ
MAAKIISVSNMKGGVGKTTISVALAQALAKGGNGQRAAKVLVVDLDAQANASFWLCGHDALTASIDAGKTIDAFLEDAIVFGRPATLRDIIRPAKTMQDHLFVAPASPNLRIVEREMIVFLSRRQRNLLEVERVVSDLLERQLAELRTAYDVIIFDTAPGISALTEAALRASHVVIVPTVPDFISNLGLLSFCRSVSWSHNDVANATKRTPWVVANKVRTTRHHQLMLKQMRAEAAGADSEFNMFRTEIPNSARIEETGSDLDAGGALAMPAEESALFAALAAEALSVASEGLSGASAA